MTTVMTTERVDDYGPIARYGVEEYCSVVVGNEHKNNGNIRHQPCNKLLYYEIVSFGGLNIRCPCHEFYDPQNVHKCKEYFSDQRGCIVHIGDSPYYIFIT